MTDINKFKANRNFMKSSFQLLEGVQTDQQLELPQPPLQKPVPPDAKIIPLPKVNPAVVKQSDIYSCLKRRRSVRKYRDEALTMDELSFLLWASQGVQRVFGNQYSTFRPVPSGGARHPFETYLLVNQVEGLETGVYRYLALSHELLLLFTTANLTEHLRRISSRQPFAAEGAVAFVWSCLPYRGEWRYHMAAHKCMLIDAGHLCQNLYLASTAIGCGTCALGEYDQQLLDSFLGLDGEDEYAVYMAPVGKV
jgi:SagB-type dehydrogenase family enzyme